ncbi:amino acid permease [Streptantibioticus cattleyicolor NRRL 8057 = DSM 46488]|uniref:Amino acid permease n=1 Tax=Streptantibioticus cattleyicolor (strain ATCC 35852 / DSM 46488 / JCM 4925 / NBRC 14057 / NRRL 8057) TaxID=1003195 RepID=G8WVC7_STREN|nr:amino acid permease [Streptantibioticus cattleyicolor NRRL 8057 = DSM 46488]
MPPPGAGGFVRRIGPFITVPAMVGAFGGPQAVTGWLAGAVPALADGLVRAELGAAMPGAGGSYAYLREAFQYRTGRLMPFPFTWTAMLFIPLITPTGTWGRRTGTWPFGPMEVAERFASDGQPDSPAAAASSR